MQMRALTAAARTICYATAVALDVAVRAHRRQDARACRRPRRAADPDRKGVLHRHRQRGGLSRRADPWRHGLHRGDRRRAALSRRAHHPDLRGHQRHPVDRPRDAQARGQWRRLGVGAARRTRPTSSSGSRPPTIRRSAPRAQNCATRSARSTAPAAGCWSASPRRRTTRWRARRPICGCSARRSAAACSPSEALAARTLGDGDATALRHAGAVLRREHHGAGRLAGAHRDRQRRSRQRRRRGAAGVAASSPLSPTSS